ncbi:uncharacterized protein RMCC_1346 [Mycolicibacterium canariasense]|uniref:Uncharacterized protein n=1 Tax=Mycolicibacterium canariasense TaxID=228230 RepID=A0A117I976_MYCCR|nr:hypothetical protein [Mycolicibacterium canariasense]MCV7208832.1 hypothetical protein [Mycolicibacterium canariasense]ORV07105.1 hypothetical protein AWB94_13970 [Mycolicibacterium canariasense]GAS94380.1 uncharacterized protein RMCC_1346 [Mycolicibacterium canariasense]
MGKDATTASDHKSTNALDDIDTGGTPIGFSFGSRTIRLDTVPEMDETFIIMLKAQVTRDGNARNAQGELIPVRTVKILDGWEPGKKPTNGADPNQGELYPTDPVTGGPTEEDGSVDTGGGED